MKVRTLSKRTKRNISNDYPISPAPHLYSSTLARYQVEWYRLAKRPSSTAPVSNYRVLGQVDQAIEYYEQALVISREIGDRQGEGADLGNLGRAYRALARLHQSH